MFLNIGKYQIDTKTTRTNNIRRKTPLKCLSMVSLFESDALVILKKKKLKGENVSHGELKKKHLEVLKIQIF